MPIPTKPVAPVTTPPSKKTVPNPGVPAPNFGLPVPPVPKANNPWYPRIAAAAPKAVSRPIRTYADMQKTYAEINNAKSDTLNANNRIAMDAKNTVNLTAGRFNTARVNPNLVRDLYAAGKRNGVDPKLMVALSARESTLLSQKGNYRSAIQTKRNAVSGWDVAESYRPYDPNRFLADKGVPGITVQKDRMGHRFVVNNQAAVEAHLARHPELLKQYNQKLKQTKTIGKQDSLDMAAQFIKQKGLARYNPGDRQYSDKVMADYHTLNNDPAMQRFLSTIRKKGGILY